MILYPQKKRYFQCLGVSEHYWTFLPQFIELSRRCHETLAWWLRKLIGEQFFNHSTPPPPPPCGIPWNPPYDSHWESSLGHPWDTPGTPLGHPWDTPGTPLGHPWDTPGTPLGHPWDTPGTPLGHPWDTPGTPLGHPWDIPETPLGHPWDTPGTPLGHPWDTPGTPLGHPWDPPMHAMNWALIYSRGLFWVSLWPARPCIWMGGMWSFVWHMLFMPQHVRK
jgi:hypothetical protein